MNKITNISVIILTAMVCSGCNNTSIVDDNPSPTPIVQANLTDITNNIPDDENTITVKAQIVDKRDSSYFIIGLDDSLQGLISVHIENLDIADVGDVISFDFNGMIHETYPAQISNISNIQLVEEKGDTIGVYRESLLELRNTDSGLDKNATEIVLDLSGINNLTSTEKEALTYLFSCDIEKFDSVYQSSMAELKKNDKIIDNDGFISFPNGVIYKISNVGEPNKSFTFDIEKWSSSLGAYGYSDCKVKLKNNNYAWEKGDEWIS